MKLFLLTHTLLWHQYHSVAFSGATFDLHWPEGTVHLCLPSPSYLESDRLLQLTHQPKVLDQRMLLGWCLVKSFGCNWRLKWWTCHAITSISVSSSLMTPFIWDELKQMKRLSALSAWRTPSQHYGPLPTERCKGKLTLQGFFFFQDSCSWTASGLGIFAIK